MHTVITQAVEALRRQRLLDELNEDFAALRSDPEAWGRELAEREEIDGTIADGLEVD